MDQNKRLLTILAGLSAIGLIATAIAVAAGARLWQQQRVAGVDIIETLLETSTTAPTISVPKTTISGGYKVLEVVDGDTIKIDYNGQKETIRLIGVDTPETKHPNLPVQCYGKEATDKTKSLVGGKNIFLEFDAFQGERDKYGRLLAYVWLENTGEAPNDTLLNYNLISNGYANEYTYRYPYKYQKEFKAAAALARAKSLGLYGPSCNK